MVEKGTETVIRNPYNEVYGILLSLGNSFMEKVPKEVMKKIITNMEYSIKNGTKKYDIPQYNLKVSLNIQGVSKEAIAMIYYIYYNYWTDSEKEKIELEDIINKNNERLEEKKCGYENIFNKVEKTEYKEENMLVPIEEEKWYTKFLKKILNLFNKKK